MSGTQLVIMAVAMGLMYWIARGMIGGYFAFFFIASPIVVGVVAGLIYGDLTKGLIIGGGIAAAFAGIIAPGGNLPTDSALAATTVIPIALATGAYGGAGDSICRSDGTAGLLCDKPA